MYNSFHPGQVWLDTDGKRIQAHGGSIFHENGKFYWYGENKEKTDGINGIWHWGVRMYESEDLYNWKDLGLIIPPQPDDPESPLYPSASMDRPHIIYNASTGKYVAWLKIMQKDGTQKSTILTADRLTGPYTIVRKNLKPLNMSAGDYDLAVAPDGKAYYYFERVHTEMICADLTEDYTDVTGYYSTHFPYYYPPFTREGIAHFVRHNKHYILSSGTTGYLPNPSEIAVGDSWHGPFRVLGDPCPDDASHTTWHSQSTSVFKVPGKKDLYIALCDRWLPEYMDIPYDSYAAEFEAGFNPEVEPDVRARIVPHRTIVNNTQIADYVWLPIRFDGEMAYLDWKDEWRLEDYE